eukprot:415175_1
MDLWQQMAQRYANNSYVVGVDLRNELRYQLKTILFFYLNLKTSQMILKFCSNINNCYTSFISDLKSCKTVESVALIFEQNNTLREAKVNGKTLIPTWGTNMDATDWRKA